MPPLLHAGASAVAHRCTECWVALTQSTLDMGRAPMHDFWLSHAATQACMMRGMSIQHS